jgi:Pyruvate/2-oxoacid:ferredoxin oxidoreductase delta subunit
LGLFFGSLDDDGYRAPLLFHLLRPKISGNAINGLGEPDRRRPTPVYHRRDIWHPFRLVQETLYWRAFFERRIGRYLRNAERMSRTPFVPIAKQRIEASPESWSEQVKEFALSHEADLVGVARMNPECVFEGSEGEVSEPWIVVLGVTMDYGVLSTAPAKPHAYEVLSQYNRGQRAAIALANWIRGQGWHARGHCGPLAGPVSIIPAAIAAGLGELGKHGSMINRKYGSSFRLAYVLTELPLAEDRPDRLGVDEFCVNCRLCTSLCPPKAIFDTKQLVRGERKWYVDFDRCVPFFNDTYGCAVCLVACPWSRPGVAERLTTKMLSKLEARDEGGRG